MELLAYSIQPQKITTNSSILLSQPPEVSAYFKPVTSVQYTFKEPYELTRNTSTQSQSSSIYSDLTLRGENVSFSFRTTQSPALLLYICSYYREYLAVLLNRNGKKQRDKK